MRGSTGFDPAPTYSGLWTKNIKTAPIPSFKKIKNHWYKVIHSFRPFLYRLFKSTSTQKRSRHSADTVPEFHAEAPQATVS